MPPPARQDALPRPMADRCGQPLVQYEPQRVIAENHAPQISPEVRSHRHSDIHPGLLTADERLPEDAAV